MRFVNIATSDPLLLMTREMEGNIVQTPKHYEPILELDPSRVISRISDWFFGRRSNIFGVHRAKMVVKII